MQLSDLTSKKPEELNVMCAELCGWHVTITEHFKILSPPSSEFGLCCGLHLDDEEVWQFGLTGDENGNYKFPNYTGSWDAIMPPILALSETNYEVFANWLFGIVWSDEMTIRSHERAFDTASPLNRTIALILTLTSQR